MPGRPTAQTSAWLTTHVRVVGVHLTDESRAYVKQKLGATLMKFARSIERASVRLKDVNGPRGGVDQLCRIKVVLPGVPSVIVERQHANLRMAVSYALRATEQAVRSTVRRRRMKPQRPRRGQGR